MFLPPSWTTCFLAAVATVRVSLPRGVSSTGFITANYPRDFPDKQQVEWDFAVPDMHNYTVHFQAHTAPECLSREVEVEYRQKGKPVTRRALTDPQPEHQQGDFKMVLRNCETNTTLRGLTLDYRVSVMRSGHPGNAVKSKGNFFYFPSTTGEIGTFLKKG